MNTNEYGQPVGFALPDWQPLVFPARIQISGQHGHLAPLDINHCEDLFKAFSLATDDRDWTWLGAQKPASLQDMTQWVENKINDAGLVPWAVLDAKNGSPVGVVCFSNIDTDNGILEIGHVTWSPLMQRTAIGTDAIYLLLNYAFSLGYRRVAWRCDSLNLASRQAAERVGFTFEGRFRQAMTRKQRNRDTDWLSVIDSEWLAVSKAVSGWLSPENFTKDGLQIRKLGEFFNGV
ncbi:GCN5 family N-acetyltransferase [Buttiauxella brennerae ATCC 51605]|uniref:GCN5 family N-acetyltransferase n=1 Tax=Buttiauxella brennerae ATCC 51605 TaxID=1354251 RepID=A0A1B7ILG2_9ENTR|nr:GNAT family protein [Buttiauxella brennerae]OAT30407.1 GCN5 family N-acetyltransferase [Buttiauxella brennerae ATCC 51605]